MPEQVVMDVTTAPRSSALIVGPYRYDLTRRWGDGPTVTWVMLNPSTADARQDDPTIRRVVGFSRRWGFEGVIVVNLFALRATNPQELRVHPDPVGPNNDAIIGCHLADSKVSVAAWGAHPMAGTRGLWLAEYASRFRRDLRCLGVTASGAPRHPLYVRSDAELVPWPGWKENSG